MARHSGATRASVSIGWHEATLRVVIQDNGTGGADPGRGSGLTCMRRRVAALDGTIRIHSPAGHGTTIEVELPCD
ncbi:MAG: sensor histidine kinase [Streptosporangiaceae bacterium]